ncbi:MAG: hypothetical protein ACO1NX_10930 [Chitinophagaceae bacterium]
MKLLVNVAPDFCWSYSLTASLYLYALVYNLPAKMAVFIIFLLVMLSEYIQLYINSFTFDVYDIAASAFAFVLALYLIKPFYEKKD